MTRSERKPTSLQGGEEINRWKRSPFRREDAIPRSAITRETPE
ncbi:MAG: hypothetical protein ABEI52_03540 [Halobacteriaceae archaeon]